MNRRSTAAEVYLNELLSCGSVPLISIPTKITSTTSTILDHIISNDFTHVLTPGVIENDISDHCAIFCNVKGYKKLSIIATHLVRDKSNLDPTVFASN